MDTTGRSRRSAIAIRGTRRDWVLRLAAILGFLLAREAPAQSNFLGMNNGSEWAFILPGGGWNSNFPPNLYYRCYPQYILYPPAGLGPTAALDVTGFEWATSFPNGGPGLGTPLFFFVDDPGLTCILSAAVGGGPPPTKAKILASPNRLAAYYFWVFGLSCG